MEQFCPWCVCHLIFNQTRKVKRMIIIKKSYYCKCNNSFLKVRKLKCENYFNSTDAPASSNFFFNSSASAFATPSLTVCGAPSTRSLASFKPKPVISRTALITATFLSPAPVNTTVKSSFSSAAGASPAAAGAAASAAADTPNFYSIAEIRSTISITDFSAIASRISWLVNAMMCVPK